MPMDRFLIAPINTGLQTDLRPWQIMDDAFTELQNAYVFRGRVRKRFGTILMGTTGNPLNSRLRASLAAGGAGIGITDATAPPMPNAAGNVRTILGDATLPLAVGQLFSIGTAVYTVISSTPGPQPMLATQGTATFDISNGNYSFVGAPPLTTIFFYTAEPVMGIDQYEIGAINNHPTYAFDQRYAYLFSGGAWNRSGTAVWHGSNLNYFWATNWQGIAGAPIFFVTNFNFTLGAGTPAATDDPIWTLDRSTGADVWTPRSGVNAFFFLPAGGAIQAGPFVQTARIIVPFKNRLVLLNTVENNNSGYNPVGPVYSGTSTQYVNRARYSFNGSPFARNAWYEPNQTDSSGGVVNNNNIAAGAGFIDATTEEAIISAEFIKDRLIVYFERSTWELAYTGNEILPFVWQQLNTELGSQSTFSTVPFDKEVLTIGNTGVHACNGSNVVRIDEKIPDEIFEFETDNSAPARTFGIRDYLNELVYWSYVGVTEPITSVFPNQILVYNYRNASWSINDDCFTAFGYFEQQEDITWASSAPTTWEQFNGSWISGVLQANQRQILGGTPEGFVLRINAEQSRNAPSMQITNMSQSGPILTLTIINHTLSASPSFEAFDQDYIIIENIIGDATTATALNGHIYQVDSVVNANTITINLGIVVIGTYTGGGTAARVSNIQITTKQFNPYDKNDRNVYIEKVNFLVMKTVSGEITVDYNPSSASDLSMIADAQATGSLIGTSVLETSPYALYPLEADQDRLSHPVYFQSDGTCIQLFLYMTPAQMTNYNIATSDFELEGMILYAQPTTSRME